MTVPLMTLKKIMLIKTYLNMGRNKWVIFKMGTQTLLLFVFGCSIQKKRKDHIDIVINEKFFLMDSIKLNHNMPIHIDSLEKIFLNKASKRKYESGYYYYFKHLRICAYNSIKDDFIWEMRYYFNSDKEIYDNTNKPSKISLTIEGIPITKETSYSEILESPILNKYVSYKLDRQILILRMQHYSISVWFNFDGTINNLDFNW